MEEFWNVYDKFRNKTDKIIKRDGDIRLQAGEYHIVVTGIIQNSDKKILITQRNANKKVYPSFWECTGGSAKVEESSIQAIIREIQEEIGIVFKIQEGELLGTIKSNNYFRDVWRFKRDIGLDEVNYNDGEVINSKWVSLDEYQKLYDEGIIVPSGEFVIKMLNEKELEEER